MSVTFIENNGNNSLNYKNHENVSPKMCRVSSSDIFPALITKYIPYINDTILKL